MTRGRDTSFSFLGAAGQRLMDNQDAKAVGDDLLRIGLINEEQFMEAFDELGPRGTGDQLFAYLERKSWITPWQTSKYRKGDREGFILGGCRILYKISSGSFGRVFRAIDPQSGRPVAIKVLRRRWSDDQQRIDLFCREGRVGLTLRHPHIVEVFTTNVDPATGQYYIVMEFVEGGNLREILNINVNRRLEPLKAVKVLEDCASALAHGHSIGITHRDIKLTNILVASSGHAKLVDFGLAKVYSALAGEDEEKVERTVDYAGLERGTNVPTGDVRSDIYFLGAAFYETLCGRPPLEVTRDRHARMQKHRFDSVRPLTRQDVNAPPSVFRLLEMMMELNPLRRYQTPVHLLEAVKSVHRELEMKAKGEGVPAGPRPVYLVEGDPRLQEALRNALRDSGYKVFMAADPTRALDLFRTKPFDGLIIDARTVGEDGLLVLDRIVSEAERHGMPFGGIVMLGHNQSDWAHRVRARPGVAVLVDEEERRVTLKQLLTKVRELVPLAPGTA